MNYFAHASAAERYATARPYFHPKAIKLLLEVTGKQRFSSVLDVACGTGMGTKALLEVSDDVTGCDTSPQMLEFARRHVPNTLFLESSAEALPFEVSSLELITTFLAFHWFDGAKFLKEAAWVLQPHGYLMIVQHLFNSTLEGHGAFKPSMDLFYENYPQPPRNPLRLEPEAAINFGFRMVAKQQWQETFPMNAKEVAEYISTQSNIIAKVEHGEESLEAALSDIEARADLFLQGKTGQFGFTGLLWVLQLTAK
jgi:ubiquinone/menaquinone biosynthesis C-methylase UbiE